MKISIKQLYSLLVIILFGLQQIGCYTIKQGELIREEVSNDIIRYEHTDVVTALPTLESPQLKLLFHRIPIYNFRYIEKYKEEKAPTTFSKTYFPILLTIGLISTVTGAGAKLIQDSTGKANVLGTYLVAGGLAVAGFSYIIQVLTNPELGETGKQIDREVRSEIVEGVKEPLKNFEFVIEAGTLRKNLATNEHGELIIDLVKDFNFSEFRYPKKINVYISSNKFEFAKEIELESQNWTSRCFRITDEEAPIYTTTNIFSKIKGKVSEGTVFRIVEEDEEGWIEVNYNGSLGWLPRYAGKIVWLAK